MSMFNKIAVSAAIAVSFAAHADLLIDDFTQGQTLVGDNVVDATGFSGTSASSPTTILGGTRDLFVIETDTPPLDNPSTGTSMDVFSGVLGFDNDSGQAGVGIVRWDGSTNTSFGATGATAAATLANAIASIDGAGLGSVNFNSSAIGFQIDVLSADANFFFTLQAYSGAGNFSQFSALTFAGPGSYVIPFAAFVVAGGTGANFNNIGALQAIINYPGTAVQDVDLRVSTARAVPAPATLALVGLALVGAGAVGRRARRAA